MSSSSCRESDSAMDVECFTFDMVSCDSTDSHVPPHLQQASGTRAENRHANSQGLCENMRSVPSLDNSQTVEHW
jgi:hypothetical protein